MRIHPSLISRFVLLAICFSVTLLGQDATGKWLGKFLVPLPSGQVREDSAFVILRQQHSEITGSLGPNESKQYPFKKGRIQGNQISIEWDGNPVLFLLRLDGEKLTGDMVDPRNQSKILGHVDLKRQ